MNALRVLSIAVLLAAGCTIEAGNGFGTIEEATVAARFDPGERGQGDGSFLTIDGHRVQVDSMQVELGELILDDRVSSGGGGGGTFDEANPPPGYSDCHGGHCHADDGRLVAYEDIEAELASVGGTSFSPMVTMVADVDADLLTGGEHVFDTFVPSRELRAGTVGRARLTLHEFHFTGTVTGGTLDAVPIVVDVHVDGALRTLDVNREVGGEADPILIVSANAAVDATFLDEVDLETLGSAGRIEIGEGSDDAEHVAEAVVGSLLEVAL